jgi:hypothetical protein
LAVEPLSRLPSVSKLENLYQTMYNYFKHSSKKHLEFQKLVDLVETKSLALGGSLPYVLEKHLRKYGI